MVIDCMIIGRRQLRVNFSYCVHASDISDNAKVKYKIIVICIKSQSLSNQDIAMG